MHHGQTRGTRKTKKYVKTRKISKIRGKFAKVGEKKISSK